MQPSPIQRRSNAFIAASWAALLIGAITYLTGLWNATLQNSEKGFYAMAFLLSLFAAVAVQKNLRDVARAAPATSAEAPGT